MPLLHISILPPPPPPPPKKKKKKIQINNTTVNQLISPSAAFMRQWIESALVQIMACRLVGAKPLSEPMLEYC